MFVSKINTEWSKSKSKRWWPDEKRDEDWDINQKNVNQNKPNEGAEELLGHCQASMMEIFLQNT